METPPPRLSDELQRLAAACQEPSLPLRSVLPGMSPRDQALLTAVLSICFLHPIPLPGLSSLFGLVIAVAGVRLSLGLGPWFPQRWLDRTVPGKSLGKVFAAGARLMRRLERVIRPRGRPLSSHPWTQRAAGAGIALGGLLLAAPAPPGANFAPATAVLLLSLGALETDLLFLAAGFAALAVNVALFSGLLWAAWTGTRALLGP